MSYSSLCLPHPQRSRNIPGSLFILYCLNILQSIGVTFGSLKTAKVLKLFQLMLLLLATRCEYLLCAKHFISIYYTIIIPYNNS